MFKPLFILFFCSFLAAPTAFAGLSCASLIPQVQNTDYNTWKIFRQPHKDMAEVKRLIPALGTFTSYGRIFAIGREQSLKSRNQRKQEGRLSTSQNKGGASHSSYLIPIKPDTRFLYVSSEMLGPYIVFTNELLDRKDYYYNSGPDYGTFFTSDAENPSGFRSTWDTKKLSKGLYPAEVLFENEVSLPEYAAAVIVPPEFKRVFQTMSLVNGINWKKMGVQIVYSDGLPSQEKLDALIAEKISWRNREPLVPDHDVHKTVRTSLELNAPTFEDQYSYMLNSENWNTELGQRIQEHFMLKASDNHFEKGDMQKVFKHLEVQLKTGSINWHWFNMFNIKFPSEQHQKRLHELLSTHNYSRSDIAQFKDQPIPLYIKFWAHLKLEPEDTPDEYRNIDLGPE